MNTEVAEHVPEVCFYDDLVGLLPSDHHRLQAFGVIIILGCHDTQKFNQGVSTNV